MSIVEKYIEYVKNEAVEKPEKSWNKILLGYKANKWMTRIAPNRDISKGYQKLESMMMSLVADSLVKKDSYVWGNIFAPSEIIQCFGLSSLSIECLSCYLGGFRLEDYFIDYAQDMGIAPTLCSYHKTFVGGVESGVVQPPRYAVTTSLSCDGNLNTFRYLEKTAGVPFTFLDVPYDDDDLSVKYLAGQLRSLADNLAELTGKPFCEEQLREIIRVENETRKELKTFFRHQKERHYPAEMVSHLYLMMGMHLLIGSREFLDLIRFMNDEISQAPSFEGTKIMWVHLIPFYQETLKKYFNSSSDYQIVATDMSLDFAEMLDEDHPFEALAKKTIRNLFNGSYDQKSRRLAQMASELRPDAVINFCHWGCKQAFGGSMLLKEKMQELGIPMINLDGDGIDKRNSHDGQIKTRLEAFLEMIKETKC